jgi:hypothetical protein
MKTKPFKHSTIGAIATVLFVASGLATADPIWSGHFQEAYNGTGQQTDEFTHNRPDVKETLLWAGQLKQAYESSPEGTRVAGPSSTEHLLWAGNFELAYQSASEKTVEFTIIAQK